MLSTSTLTRPTKEKTMTTAYTEKLLNQRGLKEGISSRWYLLHVVVHVLCHISSV